MLIITERIIKGFPSVHTIFGLTNVSYGLPARTMINRTFLVSAIGRRLDSAILDPIDNSLNGALKEALSVNERDDFCMEYITSFREEQLE